MKADDCRLPQQAVDWLEQTDRRLPAAWPPELPPQTSHGFWWTATRLEMQHRTELSERIRSLIAGEDVRLTPIQRWLYRRRVEWAGQAILLGLESGPPPFASLREFLEWLLVESWQSDGCIAFWKHAERDGQPPPDPLIDPDAQ